MHTPIYTQRLLLRPVEMTDADGFYELDSNPAVHAYLGGHVVTKQEQSEAIILHLQKQYRENRIGRWAVIEQESGRFAGWSGLKLVNTHTNGHILFYDLGYRFIPDFWGKGYATEAGKVWVQYAFDTLRTNRLFASADSKNKASIAVLQKLGFVADGEYLYEYRPQIWFKHQFNDF